MTFASSDDPEPTTLIDALLNEQRNLTAVERFARWHDTADDAAAPTYRHLLPLTKPRRGEQYAFEVDLDKCSGCKSCVAACHSLNGLDEHETWRSAGMLISATKSETRNPKSEREPKSEERNPESGFRASVGFRISDFGYQQHVTTSCHHCVDPACLDGCPVLAYDKDPLTGIVRHLDDQCIGCQYCIFMCPYEVPQYSERRGIVRKCDMCRQRLGHDEAPACVQACPNEAIRIAVINQQGVRESYREKSETRNPECGFGQPAHPSPQPAPLRGERENRAPSGWSSRNAAAFGSRNFFGFRLSSFGFNPFLPSSPDPAITLPTTRYVSAKGLPAQLIAGDAHEARVQPAHFPLVWMLVFTQLGAGGFAVLPMSFRAAQPVLAMVAGTATLLGLAGSLLHLGRPMKAWRVFLGLRRSWLSREIVVFGIFALLAMTVSLADRADWPAVWRDACLWVTAIAGMLGVFSSAMVYHATRRECWRGAGSIGRFFGTTIVLGLGAAWLCSGAIVFATVLALAMLVKLSRELSVLRLCPDDADLNDEVPVSPIARSAFLMRFRLGPILRLRLACGWIGGVVLPVIGVIASPTDLWMSAIGLTLCVAGELLERTLFFRAVVATGMPGGAGG